MKKYIATILASLICSTAFASDLPYTQGPMTPIASEQLSIPIKLTGNCVGVEIIEWRPTPGQTITTSFTDASKKILNDTCQLAVNNFTDFVISYGYSPIIGERFAQHISLMPADINNHGQDIRNLNDSSYRFYHRSKEYYEDGRVIPIWGYHQLATSYIYIRNDVLISKTQANREFRKIFAHELFHALSYQYQIFDQYPNATDEMMARKFTASLDLGE